MLSRLFQNTNTCKKLFFLKFASFSRAITLKVILDIIPIGKSRFMKTRLQFKPPFLHKLDYKNYDADDDDTGENEDNRVVSFGKKP